MSTKIEEIRNKILAINKKYKKDFYQTCSVSKLCNYLKPEFDEITQAERCAEKGKNNPDYKYYNMTADEIIKLWHDKSDTSKHYGRLLDEFTEYILIGNKTGLKQWEQMYNWDNDLRLKNICTGAEQFINWLTSKTNYRYVDREIVMYVDNDGNKVNGRLDCLFYDENTDAYIIIDWKTTDNITTSNEYRKKLFGPMYNLDECDMNVYTTQLHLYKKALVETYKLTSYDKISVYVCNLLREPINNVYYKVYPQNFIYDNNLLNSTIKFANMKFNTEKIRAL